MHVLDLKNKLFVWTSNKLFVWTNTVSSLLGVAMRFVVHHVACAAGNKGNNTFELLISQWILTS